MDPRRMTLGMILALLPFAAAAGELDTATIVQALGRSGEMSGEVYRVGFPRSDLRVQVQGIAIQPGLALGSWAAFSGSEKEAMVMGDLVLLSEEVPKVMKRLRAAGFEISAIHNHLLGETPRITYMHYMGRGAPGAIAASLRTALEATATPAAKPASAGPGAATASQPAPPGWAGALEEALGRKGSFRGGVLSFSIPRKESILMGGMPLAPAQGVAEAINFQEAGPGKVATTGDFVLQSEEVNPVLSALLEHGIDATALHSHMLDEQPRLFFLHFWAVGDPREVGAGIRAALGHVSIR
jgi:hypothetical protein